MSRCFSYISECEQHELSRIVPMAILGNVVAGSMTIPIKLTRHFCAIPGWLLNDSRNLAQILGQYSQRGIVDLYRYRMEPRSMFEETFAII